MREPSGGQRIRRSRGTQHPETHDWIGFFSGLSVCSVAFQLLATEGTELTENRHQGESFDGAKPLEACLTFRQVLECGAASAAFGLPQPLLTVWVTRRCVRTGSFGALGEHALPRRPVPPAPTSGPGRRGPTACFRGGAEPPLPPPIQSGHRQSPAPAGPSNSSIQRKTLEGAASSAP
jgi:hypothetical protein